MVCVFFGHKDAPTDIRDKLETVVEELICAGIREFLVGNQGSFDRMVLGVLRGMALRYPEVHYQVVLAYLPQRQAQEYREGETVYPEGMETVHPRCAISHRNRWMIDEADMAVVYVTHDWGGAAKAAALADKKGKKIIPL